MRVDPSTTEPEYGPQLVIDDEGIGRVGGFRVPRSPEAPPLAPLEPTGPLLGVAFLALLCCCAGGSSAGSSSGVVGQMWSAYLMAGTFACVTVVFGLFILGALLRNLSSQ